MKKILYVVLAFILALGTFTGCKYKRENDFEPRYTTDNKISPGFKIELPEESRCILIR